MSKLNDEPIAQQEQSQNGGPPNVRSNSELPDEPAETTNITDVNDNCLEHIFKHLDLSDLLNIADSSKLLQNAARLAFTSKYGNKTIRLDFVNMQKDRTIDILSEEIIIYDFSTCLKMLRCFGASITKLVARSLDIAERESDELDRYLIEYCAESVVYLEYGGATLDHLTKSFPNVETVCFSSYQFQCEPTDIQRCFPSLRELQSSNPDSMQSIVERFPNLERLDTHVSDKQHEKLAMCLQLNPQLKSLNIVGFNYNSKFLRILAECPQLEFLDLLDTKNIDLTTDNSDTGSIKFKTVRKFVTNSYYLKRLDEANISIRFDQLVELTIIGPLDESVVRFISKHPIITKFSWNDLCVGGHKKETLLHLAKALPSVTELHKKCTTVSSDSVFDFINECHLLKVFEFLLDTPDEYDNLRDSLGTDWRSSIDKFNIIKLER